MLAAKINNPPSPARLLDVDHSERRHFGAPQSSAQEYRQDRPVTESFGVVASGEFRSFCACWTETQFPKRTPFDATPFTRVIPVANSGRQ
jgi:hypothetical protein